MNTLEPRSQLPLLWAVRELLGVTKTIVLHHISRGQYYRARRGMRTSSETRAALIDLARQTMVDISDASLAWMKQSPPPDDYDYRDHRMHVFSEVRRIIAISPDPARQTDLSRTLLTMIAVTGAPRRRVIESMWPHRPNSVRRAAKRLGVRELVKPGKREGTQEVWWLPPDASAPLPPPKIKPRSDRAAELMSSFERIVVRGADGWMPADDVEAALRAQGFSRPLIYRTLRDACIRRRTSGFGSRKRTWWAMPEPLTLLAGGKS